MLKDTIILCILIGVSLVYSYCPKKEIRAYGECMFRINCLYTISQSDNIQLPAKCLGSTNYPVMVNVHLNEADERADKDIDTDFLNTITYFKISAKWKEATFTMLKHTTKLKSLILVDMGLENIIEYPFYRLNQLEELNLSHNNLTEIQELFKFEDYPNKLRRLLLAHNAITDIPKSTFEELSSLTELDLSYNKISDLTVEPFYNLTNLEILRLNNNQIKDLNGAVNSLHKLKHLYLRGNHIQNIDDESLKTIEHLETFDVSRNELEDMKPIIFSRHWNHFENYSNCRIILSENHISIVPNGTYKQIYVSNRSLDIHTEVDLSVNSIEFIEYNAFQSLIHVEVLDLSRNKIKNFFINDNDMAYLKYLNLSSNFISHLHFESFSRMNNLQNLDLSNNQLDFIPDMSFTSNYNLKLVNMTYNAIEKLESLHIIMFHPEGGVLDLSNNKLSDLKIPFGEGIRLFTLKLHSNNISNSALIDLSLQTDLKSLDMSINDIHSLDIWSLRLPMSLESLDLTDNKIHRIGPSTFHALVNLKFLRLGHNQLSSLEYGAFNALGSLYYLDLSYNRIRTLDSKMLMDLKSLTILSVRSNDMYNLDYKSWHDHKNELQVYIDNNNLTCDWLVEALQDYKNEFSKMLPVVLVPTKARESVDGIPCLSDDNISAPMELRRMSRNTDNAMVSERLLIVTQKILEAVREENTFMRQMLWLHLQKEKERSGKSKKIL